MIEETIILLNKIAPTKARGDDTIEVKLIEVEDNIYSMFMDLTHEGKTFRSYFPFGADENSLPESIDYAYEQIEERKKKETS